MNQFIDDHPVIFATLATLLTMIVIIGLSVLIVIPTNQAVCNAQTESIGMDHRWSLLGGCQVEVQEGQWVPLENYYYKESQP